MLFLEFALFLPPNLKTVLKIESEFSTKHKFVELNKSEYIN